MVMPPTPVSYFLFQLFWTLGIKLKYINLPYPVLLLFSSPNNSVLPRSATWSAHPKQHSASSAHRELPLPLLMPTASKGKSRAQRRSWLASTGKGLLQGLGKLQWVGSHLVQHEPASHGNSRRPENRAHPWPHPTTHHPAKRAPTAPLPPASALHLALKLIADERDGDNYNYTKSFIVLRALRLKISTGNYRKGSIFLACSSWEFNNTSYMPHVTVSHLQTQSNFPYCRCQCPQRNRREST